MRTLTVAAAAALAVGTGCADFQFNLAVDSTAAVLQRGSKSLDMESDVTLAREAIPGTIKTVDSFLAAAPENPVFLELTTQAYAQYAFGFLEDDLERLPPGDSPERARLVARATGLYDRAYEIALRLVALSSKDFPKAAKADAQTLEAALAAAKPATAHGLYWAGMALGSAINLHRDDVDRIAELPRAIAMLKRSHELDAAYFNHGAAMTLGVAYCSQAKAMGGDPDLGKKLFQEVIDATSGKYLLGKVLMARFCATVTLDRELFEKTLKEVLATPADAMPEQRLANELAKIRAARYLGQADDLF